MIHLVLLIVCEVAQPVPKDTARDPVAQLEHIAVSEPHRHKEVAEKAIAMLRTRQGNARRLLAIVAKTGPVGSKQTEQVLTFLVDDDVLVRREAAFAIGQICSREAIDIDFTLLKSGLKDPDSLVREHSVYAIGLLRGKGRLYVVEVKSLFDDKDVSVATEAARSFFRITGDTKEAMPVLIRGLTKDGPAQASLSAFSEIGIRGKEAFPHVSKLANHKNWFTRGLAIMALCNMTDDPNKVVKLVVNSQRDSEKFVSLMAIRAFLKFEKEGADCLAGHIQRTKGVSEVVDSIEVLGNFGAHGKHCIPLLNHLLTHPDTRVRDAARVALSNVRKASCGW